MHLMDFNKWMKLEGFVKAYVTQIFVEYIFHTEKYKGSAFILLLWISVRNSAVHDIEVCIS